MTLSILRKTIFLFCCLGLLSAIMLAACSDLTSPSTSSTSATPTLNAATATAAVQALIKEMTIIGTPTAKIVTGTTFEVDGHIKNGDILQHDIYIEASLLNAAGKPIVTTAPYNVDDVHGGETVPFAVQGTTPQPTWAGVRVVVVTVKENVNGTGTD